MQPPSGTVTFLFTDIEVSTRLWEERPDEMNDALAEHDAIVRGAIDEYRGYVFSTGGDGFAAAFSRASDAVDAAVKAQAGLVDQPIIRVRMGIHTGEVHERDGDYFGPAVNRAARIMAAGHGGQVLVSDATRQVLGGHVALLDLGVHALRDLSAPVQLFQLGHEAFPPLRTVDVYATNLTPQLSEFVGRRGELAEITDLLGRHRLVTLTGPGGTGKTRLALQVAAAVLPNFADGVWLVELAGVTDPDELPAAVAASLHVQQRVSRTMTESLVAVLADRRMLLLLDNCEHLLDAVADFASDISAGCRDVTVLATSREGIGIDGERIVVVRPLAVPDSADDALAFDAVRLFCERAKAASATFSLTPDNVGDVVELCRRLDGLPLALELAASRVGALTAHDILANLDDRFRLLAAGRGARRRHQTLEGAIDWSFNLLNDAERALLCRLSVFAGGFRADSAAEVCAGDPLPSRGELGALLQLVSKSLVVADTAGATARYRLLETVREYGWSKLGDEERRSLQDAHARHLVDLAERIDAGTRGPDEAHWVRRLREELDNIRVAFAHLEEHGDVDAAARLAVALRWNGFLRGGYGISGYCERCLLMLGDEEHSRRAQLLTGAGLFAWMLGDIVRVSALSREADSAGGAPDPLREHLRSLEVMSTVGLAEARACFSEALRVCLNCGDDSTAAAVCWALVLANVEAGDVNAVADGVAVLQEITSRVSNPSVAAVEACARSAYGLLIRDYDGTLRTVNAGLAWARDTDSQLVELGLRQMVGQIHAFAGDLDAAIEVFRADLDIGARYGQPGFRLYDLMFVHAPLAARGDEPEAGALLAGFSKSVPPSTRRMDELVEPALRSTRETLGDERYDALVQRGREMSLDEITRVVRAALDRQLARINGAT